MINSEEFNKKGYTVLRNFIDKDSINTLSKYYENFLKRYPLAHRGGDKINTSKITWYADPLMEVMLENSLPEIEKITNHKLFPTYSFVCVYTKGDELKPHMDRPACEISVTCNIATVGEKWPIWMQAPGQEPSAHYLEPGDACIYHGCEIKHWREVSNDTDINVQFMLHYIRQDGSNADHKFDKRQGIALPSIRG